MIFEIFNLVKGKHVKVNTMISYMNLMLVITVLFITIASCDPSVDDNKPPDKNDPTVNTNVNNGGTTSANEKKELTLPSIYSNIYSQINVYSIFTQSGEYTNMPYFIPVNPGF